VNSYSMCLRNFKWTTKLFFHLLDLTVLNSWLLLSSCGAKCTDLRFQISSGEEFDQRSWKKSRSPHPQFDWKAKCGCSKVMRLDSRHNQHVASEGAPCTSAQNVTWVCAWCHVSPITTQKQICKPGNYN
jgi:hypothetical protein